MQIALEDVQKATYPDRMFLCDRGTCDGAAYWPEGTDDFFKQMGTTEEEVSLQAIPDLNFRNYPVTMLFYFWKARQLAILRSMHLC